VLREWEYKRWGLQCCVLRVGRKCAVGDTLFCEEMVENLSGGP